MAGINIYIKADDDTHYYMLSDYIPKRELPVAGEVILTQSPDKEGILLDFEVCNIIHCSRYEPLDKRGFNDGDVVVKPMNNITENWCEETLKDIFNTQSEIEVDDI